MTRSCAWPVSMTVRFHLFPFRTQKLSSLVPKIVGWRRPVKIGRCRLLYKAASGPSLGPGPEFALYAPLAQLVEQLTLNQWVLGSSPRWCTKRASNARCRLFSSCCHCLSQRKWADAGRVSLFSFAYIPVLGWSKKRKRILCHQ